MGRARFRGAGVVFFLLLVDPLLHGCSPSPARSAPGADPPPPPRAVTVRVARPEPVPVDDSFPSSLYVERDVRLRTRLSGRIEKIHVDRGARVRSGQILAEVETDLATAELAIAEQTERMADVDFQSTRSLRDQKMISENEFLRAETARDLAASRTELARNRLERCRVRSPFDGIVVERWAQIGQRVQEDENTPLFRVVANDPLRARVDVPEDRLAGVARGTAVAIEVAGESAPVPAKVVFVSPAVDPASGTAPVIVEASVPGGLLRPGVSVRIRFEGFSAFQRAAFRIPREAAPEDAAEGRDATVLVVAQGRVTTRTVKVLESRVGSLVVAGEIGPDDRVIVGARAGLKAGDRVDAIEEAL